MASPEPGALIGGYRLGSLLGQGATGVVFRAEAIADPGRTVALKLLRPERTSDDVARARFGREARLVRGIASRHLVQILELGESDGVIFLVMPFYGGGSLAQHLRRVPRMAPDDALRLAAELGRGLDELHERQIVHRDVKPSNVLLDTAGVAALTDFGLARAIDSTRLTAEGQIVGTAHYLAPELIEGREATEASDIYALGCLLYECIAGQPPFAGRNPAEIAYAHLTESAADPRVACPELPAEVADALLLALDKDPAHRPTSATALSTMLRAGRRASPV